MITRQLIAVTTADENGVAKLLIPAETAGGTYLLYSSAVTKTPNSLEIKVENFDGETEKMISKNAYLKSLVIDGQTFSPNFSKFNEKYELVVPEEISQITIAAEAEHEKTTVSGTGVFQMPTTGNHSATLTVTAQDGTQKNYEISIIRGKSTDATIRKLFIAYSLGMQEIEFSPETTEITTHEGYNPEFNFAPVLNHSGAKSEFPMWFPILHKTTTATIKVTAEDGITTRIYTITNICEECQEEENSALSKIENSQISIFPNPTSNAIFLENLPNESEIRLLNLTSKTLLQTRASQNLRLDLSAFPSGSYILQINNFGTMIVKE